MSKKLTLSEVKERLRTINPDIEVLSDRYERNNKPLKCKCLKCKHIWRANYNNLQSRKTKCPKCARKSKCLSSSEVKKRLKSLDTNILVKGSYYNTRSKLQCECLKCGRRWEASFIKLTYVKTKCPRCAKKESKVEINFLNTFEGWHKDRKILNGKELDAYFDKEKLAIEINGCFWHSTLHERIDKAYHLDKTNLCEQRGVKLLHFWDFEIKENFDFCKQVVLERLGLLDDLEYFKIKEIKPLHFELFDSNDIKRSNLYLKHIGSNTYEITEFSGSNKQNLYDFFVSEYKPNKIIAKLNRRFHSLLDNYALNLGFKLRRITKPSYFHYLDKNAKCYDCGSLVYIKSF